jgi:hypothetical protein
LSTAYRLNRAIEFPILDKLAETAVNDFMALLVA